MTLTSHDVPTFPEDSSGCINNLETSHDYHSMFIRSFEIHVLDIKSLRTLYITCISIFNRYNLNVGSARSPQCTKCLYGFKVPINRVAQNLSGSNLLLSSVRRWNYVQWTVSYFIIVCTLLGSYRNHGIMSLGRWWGRHLQHTSMFPPSSRCSKNIRSPLPVVCSRSNRRTLVHEVLSNWRTPADEIPIPYHLS